MQHRDHTAAAGTGDDHLAIGTLHPRNTRNRSRQIRATPVADHSSRRHAHKARSLTVPRTAYRRKASPHGQPRRRGAIRTYDRLAQWAIDDSQTVMLYRGPCARGPDAMGRHRRGRLVVRARGAAPPRRPWPDRRVPGRLPVSSRTAIGYFEVAAADRDWVAVRATGSGCSPGSGRRCSPARSGAPFACAPVRDGRQASAAPARSAMDIRPRPAPGVPPDPAASAGHDVRLEVVRGATHVARRYLARPNIIHLHGVTAAMAVSILIRHVDEATAATATGLRRGGARHGLQRAGRSDPSHPHAGHRRCNAGRRGDRPRLRPFCQARSGRAVRAPALTDDPVFVVAAERVPPDAASARSPRHSTWTAGDLDPPATPAPTSRTAIGRRPRSVVGGRTTPEEDSDGDGTDGVDRSGPVHGRRDL